MPNLWYKNAVFYCIDVKSFMDSDGDGWGDFKGLADRLDHLERLGVTCIWLNPFYPSPHRDNGYDVIDYYGVDERLGTLGDFVEFMHAAKDRGMRVIVDLVVNHCSIDHPWYQSAREDENSPYRDWFVWSKEKPDNIEDGIVFPGVQKATWTHDRKAGAWYMHRFYWHQPDLNVANPAVREEILKIMGFWLALGVSGFRIDAVPFLIENRGLPDGGNAEPYQLLSDMHDFMAWRKAESVLLAEANIPYDVATQYFESGERMSLVFDFLLNQYTFLSFARHSAADLRRALQNRPEPGGMGQWASFLRNHDEVDLGRLSSEERQECFDAFGPDKNMQVYERGIRRRLAGMLGGNEDRIRMAMSLMLAIPGTPVVWYGEEIGMGENLALEERESVRTPMQWNDDATGGFSTAPLKNLLRTPPKGAFAPKQVNVNDQVRKPESLMHAVSAMIRTRRSTPEVGWGDWEVLDLGTDDILGLTYAWRGYRVVTVHNFRDAEVAFSLEMEGIDTFLPLLASHDHREPIASGQKVTLDPYGYIWMRCDKERR